MFYKINTLYLFDRVPLVNFAGLYDFVLAKKILPLSFHAESISCVWYHQPAPKMTLTIISDWLKVEARTGYGGGYNERGVVEYRRREPSSEDEYDEFGRKRRKRKDAQKSENQDMVRSLHTFFKSITY